MSTDPILYKNKGNYLQIEFNNPKKLNSLNLNLMKEFINELDKVKEDKSIKAVYLCSNSNKYFSAGVDLSIFIDENNTNEDIKILLKNFLNYLITYPKLLIAGVNGLSIGITFTMLLHFDIILSSNNSTFWTPFIQNHMVPEGGSSLYFPRIFKKVAGNLLYKGEPLSAEDAYKFGFITKMIDSKSFNEEAENYLKDILQHPLDSLIKFKYMIKKNEMKELIEVNEYEADELFKAFNTNEFKKRVQDFVKKTKF